MSARQNYALQFDARLAGTAGKTDMQVRFQHGRLPGDEWGQFILQLNSDPGRWWFDKLWPGRNYHSDSLGAAVSVGETTHVTIVAGGSRFAVVLNGKPVYYRDDPDFVLPGELFRLFSCYTHTAPAVCEFDNVKFWKLGE